MRKLEINIDLATQVNLLKIFSEMEVTIRVDETSTTLYCGKFSLYSNCCNISLKNTFISTEIESSSSSK